MKAAIFFMFSVSASVLSAQNEQPPVILPDIDTTSNKFQPASYEYIESPAEEYQAPVYEYNEAPAEKFEPANYEYIEQPTEKYQPASLLEIDSSLYNNQPAYSGDFSEINNSVDSVNVMYDPVRKIISSPAYDKLAEEEGKIAVDIWVDADGDVVSVQYNAAASDSESTALIERALGYARKLHYVSKPFSGTEKVSMQVFEFKRK